MLSRISFFTLALFFISVNIYSQSGWFITTDSIPDRPISSICFPDENTGYASFSHNGTASGQIYKTTNAGNNWQITNFNSIYIKYIHFLNANTGFFLGGGFSDNSIYKTTNGGINWVSKFYPAHGMKGILKFYNNNTGIVASDGGGLYKTTNGGENWYSIQYAPWPNSTSLIALEPDVWIVASQYIFKTTNGGTNWRMLDFSGIGMQTYTLSFINNTTGYSSSQSGKIYKTINAGENWVYVSTLISTFYSGLNMVFVNELTGYLSSSEHGISVMKTTNGGYNWTIQSINSYSFFDYLEFINPNTGFAGDYYGRIYKTTNGGTVFVSNISNEIPERFELGQNYPNPFNQSTIFNLQCSMKGNVSVKVFDAAGREVQTLVNETLAPGTYQVRFDGSGLASGLYYYSMSIDGKQTAVKKMVMVK